MNRRSSCVGAGFLCALLLTACAQSSGQPVAAIAEPAIAAAYLPLQGRVHLGLDTAQGAAMVIAPGIAVTNGHNANLLDRAAVIAASRDYDLLFFRTARSAAPATAAPAPGQPVTAYGQGLDGELRIAHGIVRGIENCGGCTAPAYFTFEGDAGPGFSGGPVVDGKGALLGITFGYKDRDGVRLIYAYDMARVAAERTALHVR